MKKITELLNPYRGMRKEIYIIFLSRTVNAMGALIFPFMTLLLSNKIGLSGEESGFYFMLSGLCYAPASLIGGKLCDHLGRKKILIGAQLLAACAYTLCIFLPTDMTMVYTLMMASFFFGIAGPPHEALMADLTTDDQRQGAYSLSYLGFNFGFAVAQILAGFLFQNHLRLMFIIDVATALAAITLIALFVKEPEHKGDRENKLEEASSESVFKVLLGRPVLIALALAVFGYKFIYAQWSFMIPLHGEYNFPGMGARLFGFLGSFNALVVVLFTPLLTSLLSKKTNIRKIFYAGIFFTLGFGLLGFISTWWAFFISVFIFTLGEILEAISTMPFIMNRTPASHRGRMSSILPLIMGAGYSIGPLIMGTMTDLYSFETCWKIVATLVLISALGVKAIDIRESLRKT